MSRCWKNVFRDSHHATDGRRGKVMISEDELQAFPVDGGHLYRSVLKVKGSAPVIAMAFVPKPSPSGERQ